MIKLTVYFSLSDNGYYVGLFVVVLELGNLFIFDRFYSYLLLMELFVFFEGMNVFFVGMNVLSVVSDSL